VKKVLKDMDVVRVQQEVVWVRKKKETQGLNMSKVEDECNIPYLIILNFCFI